MKTRGKPVDISGINVSELESWIHESTDRQNAVKCQALIALTKNVSVRLFVQYLILQEKHSDNGVNEY